MVATTPESLLASLYTGTGSSPNEGRGRSSAGAVLWIRIFFLPSTCWDAGGGGGREGEERGER